jgi:C4-dicarboxylate-specific signal transduction histidine kinase/ActR/RegA family two-component response regulator
MSAAGLLLRTCVPLALAWVFELFSRAAYVAGFVDGTQRDLFGLAGFFLLTLSSIFLLFMLRGATWLKWMMVGALSLLMIAQLSDVVDEFKAVQAYPLLARRHPWHLLFEHCIFISGCVLLMATSYAALIHGELRRRELKQQQNDLEESIAQRRQAELELKQARDRLEQEVEARTAQLADRNMRLAIELSERKKFEEKLEDKLRYEEGLAACSRTLVSGADPAAVFNQALQHLACGSRTHRAYLYLFNDGGLNSARLDAFHGEAGSGTVYSHIPVDELTPLCEGEPLALQQSGQHHPAIISALLAANARAALLLPIYWEGQWQGVLGFEDLREERDWAQHEVRILQTAGEMIAACKQRYAAEEALRSAYDDLEIRVEERTRDLTIANEMLNQEIMDRNRLEKDKVQLQAKLRQAQKMQAIGTLAGGIAHDFNNILASILGYTELALERLPPGPQGQQQRRYHEEVLKAAHRAKDLTHQILLFSRQADQQKTAVFPHLIAQEVLALLDVSCPSNIRIERNIANNTGAVLSDTVHMHQVLLNLCTNAQHAMKMTGGTMTVTVKPVHLDERISTLDGELATGDYVYIAVRDTGEGIDPAAQERIFDPFFTTKSVEEGTGMGLAIVHGIVTGQGGGIRCESRLGAGALFEVFLPVYNGPAHEQPRSSAERLRGTEHVLVVDDEPQLVELWREVLEGYGYTVTGFDSSVTALESFRADPDRYDAALLDQTMPGLTGADIARSLLAERPDMPIIVATGFSESLSPELAREIGLADLIYKPILGVELATAIRRAIDSSAPAIRI